MDKKNKMVQINVLLTPDTKKKLDLFCVLNDTDITKEVRGDIEKKISKVSLPGSV